MKKFFILIIFLALMNYVFCNDTSNYVSWKIKSIQEKQNYIKGLLDGIYELGSEIDLNISKLERLKEIDTEIADKIEIPVIVGMFLYGNSSTNGINSLIDYIDICYTFEEFRTLSVYQILINKSEIELKKLPQFKWMFEE